MISTTIRIALGLVLGAAAAHVVACGEQSDDPRAITSCRSYCERSSICDDTDMADCQENCRQLADDCMDDELDLAIDRLDECAQESCDEFTECSFGAGAECLFGL